jgi:formate dehydrogenase maturation protein FdhE
MSTPDRQAMIDQTIARAEECARVHAVVAAHIADATHEELRTFVDEVLEPALSRRAGSFAPFVHAAMAGLRQSLSRAHGVPPTYPRP